MLTIICHFYNEEYLLPWWLEHHKQYFDHGIMINYNSTDNSVSIINKICPSWEIVNSRNKTFDAHQVDAEVEDIEKSIKGWRIALNVTEFLIGNFKLIDNEDKHDIFIRSAIMVDTIDNEYVEPHTNKSLILQRFNGIFPSTPDVISRRRLRRLSNEAKKYPLGRHFVQNYSEDFLILWYGFSPFTDNMLKRKLQIQNRMPQTDKDNGFGFQHLTNTAEQIKILKLFQLESTDIFFNNKYSFSI